MIIINDIRDSYGCFSMAGKKSIEENILLIRHRKKKLLGKKSRSSSSYSNLFNISRDKIKLEIRPKENDFDIFTVEEPDKEKLDDIAKDIVKKSIQKIEKRNSEKLNNNNKKEKEKDKDKEKIKEKVKEKEKEKENSNNNSFNLKFQAKYFFHINTHNKKIKKKTYMVPPCTKYHPKYDAILRRSASTPLWKSVTGRKEQKKDIYDFPFYLKHELIQDNMAGKTFIDFSKQTIRKCFLENNKDNSNNNSINILKKRALSCRNKSANLLNKISFKNRNNKEIKNNKENKNNINYLSDTNTSNDSYDIYKNVYTKKLMKKKIEYKAKKEKEMEESKKKIKTINFNQALSREALDELENNKIAVVPYLFPNFKLIRERPVMMVVYDRKKHKINKNTIDKYKFENFFINDKNNHHVHTPNFDLMTSRPYDDKDPLPTYMKKIFDKNSCYKITGDSLKLNNYSNRGFMMNKSTFWPKDTFNKFINLNYIKSRKKFYEALLFNKNKGNEKQLLEKSLSFYSKNLKDIIKKDNTFKINNALIKSAEKNETRKEKKLSP